MVTMMMLTMTIHGNHFLRIPKAVMTIMMMMTRTKMRMMMMRRMTDKKGDDKSMSTTLLETQVSFSTRETRSWRMEYNSMQCNANHYNPEHNQVTMKRTIHFEKAVQ